MADFNIRIEFNDNLRVVLNASECSERETRMETQVENCRIESDKEHWKRPAIWMGALCVIVPIMWAYIFVAIAEQLWKLQSEHGAPNCIVVIFAILIALIGILTYVFAAIAILNDSKDNHYYRELFFKLLQAFAIGLALISILVAFLG